MGRSCFCICCCFCFCFYFCCCLCFCFYGQMQQQVEFKAEVIATTSEAVLASSCPLTMGCNYFRLELYLPSLLALLLLLLPFSSCCFCQLKKPLQQIFAMFHVSVLLAYRQKHEAAMLLALNISFHLLFVSATAFAVASDSASAFALLLFLLLQSFSQAQYLAFLLLLLLLLLLFYFCFMFF